MSAVLGNKDVNAVMDQQNAAKDVKSMEYHRQVFQSKMAAETYVLLSSPAAARQRLGPRAPLADAASRTKQYVSPSDNIMSPCTAKINALRNKHASKAKPKSLFAQASVKKLNGENSLGARSIQQ
ncbi:hypothetical protein E5D57_007381 [Metarhizium anisopliae]|nr:hypothetical protein E5D57_007381 [Metarhizium anisopliae]